MMESAVEIASIQLQLEHAAMEDMEKSQQFLTWPSIQPVLRVPYFDRELYKNVDLTVQASEQENGLDLPFDDIATLRFFFNLGVQQCRAVLLSQLHDQLRTGTMLQLHVQLPPEQHQDDISSSSRSSSTSSDSPSSTCSTCSSNPMPSPTCAQSEQICLFTYPKRSTISKKLSAF